MLRRPRRSEPSKATCAASLCEMPSLRRGRRPHHVRRNASEPERSHVRPQAAEPTGPHREGEEPKPMMHGHEKSDSAIVAMKPPNNVGRPAAEAVERRAGAKENANRYRTCRTQGRASVSQAPERVRTAARPAVNIRGGSRMQESCTYGSVRGALSNGRPYRIRCVRTRRQQSPGRIRR
jgi:hypothetical protein